MTTYAQDWDNLKGGVNLATAHPIYPFYLLDYVHGRADALMSDQVPRPVRDFAGNRPSGR